MAEVSKETRSVGVRFVGIDTRDQTAAALAFESSYNITYPSLVDEDGRLSLALSEQLPANAIPSTLVVDRDGNVAGRIIGATQYTQLKQLVLRVAKESAP
jgi:peroxiredoxin